VFESTISTIIKEFIWHINSLIIKMVKIEMYSTVYQDVNF